MTCAIQARVFTGAHAYKYHSIPATSADVKELVILVLDVTGVGIACYTIADNLLP